MARTTFLNNAGDRITGEVVADTILVWMVKVEGQPVQVLNKREWSSMPDMSSFEDIFSMFNRTGGR